MEKILLLLLVLVSISCSAQNSDELQLLIPKGHTKTPYSMAFSPNGKYLLTGGEDGTAKLWETDSGRMLYNLSGHEVGIWCVLFSPDGKYILTTSRMEMKLWETQSGKLLDSFELDFNKSHEDRRLFIEKFDYDGLQLHTYDDKGIHLLWKLNPLEVDKPISDDTKEDGFIFQNNVGLNSPTGFMAASDHRYPVLSVINQEHGVEAFAPSRNKKFLLVATKDRLLQIWRLLDNRLLKEIKLSGVAYSIKFSPQGQYALIIGRNKPFLLDTKNWMEHYLNRSPGLGWANFSSDDRYLLTSTGVRLDMYDIKEQQVTQSFGPGLGRIHTVLISPNNEYVVTTSVSGEVGIWRVETGNLLYTLGGHVSALEGAQLSPDGNYLATWVLSHGPPTNIWNLQTGRVEYTIPNRSIWPPQFSPDGQLLISGDSLRSIAFTDVQTGQALQRVNEGGPQLNTVFFSQDSEYVIASHEEGLIFWKANSNPLRIPNRQAIPGLRELFINEQGDRLYTYSRGNLFKTWSFPDLQPLDSLTIGRSGQIVLSPKGDFLVVVTSNEGLSIWDLSTHEKVTDVSGVEKISDFKFSPNGELILTASRDNTGAIIQTKDGTILSKLIGHTGWLSKVAVNPAGTLAVTGSYDNVINLWSLPDGNLLKTITGHEGEIKSLTYSADGEWIISSSTDGTCKIWQSNGEEVCTLMSTRTGEYACVIPDNYYLSTQVAATLMNWRIGLEIFNFEQFDLQFNRPDKVLEQLGLSAPEVINGYQEAYKTRLWKMDFEEKRFSSTISLPTLEVTTDSSSISTVDSILNLCIQAWDEKRQLDRLNIWINDVPIYGRRGYSLREARSKSWEGSIPVRLSQGKNKIQVSVFNEGQLESLKETLFANYDAPIKVKPNLYIIAVGVDTFADASLNLQYAVKDLRDFINIYQQQPTSFNQVFVDSLFNEDVTIANLTRTKTKLMQSGVDDRVILFVAGHGLRDEKLKLYFAPRDMDFSNPAATGIPYDALESILDGIPARQKLFLMDACYSGEVDKRDIELVQLEMEHKKNVRLRSFDQGPRPQYLGLDKPSFELMKEVFVELRRGTGATVISSASGVEFAYEGDEWRNSVFTYCLLSGLKDKKADGLNKDGLITISELRDYLQAEVKLLTDDYQRPNTRRENISNDWQVW